jgi:hypothetical protein
MLTTLVIHPRDPSTDFLKILYARMPRCTVVSADTSEREIRRLVAVYDRILLLGHGCPAGLVDRTGAFGDTPKVLIGDSYADLLGAKKDAVVFVWCRADEYVRKHRLSGFCTGMFVSETAEAVTCGFAATQSEVDASNALFVECLAKCIADTTLLERVHKTLCEGAYGALAETNPVAAYNHARLFLCRAWSSLDIRRAAQPHALVPCVAPRSFFCTLGSYVCGAN